MSSLGSVVFHPVSVFVMISTASLIILEWRFRREGSFSLPEDYQPEVLKPLTSCVQIYGDPDHSHLSYVLKLVTLGYMMELGSVTETSQHIRRIISVSQENVHTHKIYT